MGIQHFRNCSVCGDSFKMYNTIEKKCGKCRIASKQNKPAPRQAIKPVSDKRAADLIEYGKLKKHFFLDPVNNICPVTGQQSTDVHHKKGRVGYADRWARIMGISLLLDTRFWLGVSREGHQWIELHPEEAKELGYSLSRLTND